MNKKFNLSHLVVLSTPNHPLFDQLKKVAPHFFSVDFNFKSLDKNKLAANCAFSDFILDFTILHPALKDEYLKQLTSITKCPLIVEGSCYWNNNLLQKFSAIKAIMSCSFYSPTQKFEYFATDEFSNLVIKEFFQLLQLTGVKVNNPGMGFYFPRTISMIINEAYFALEENLASSDDLNLAMKNGVGHPLGPIEWSQKIGPEKIIFLLDELREKLGDSRYKASLLLREEAEKIILKLSS